MTKIIATFIALLMTSCYCSKKEQGHSKNKISLSGKLKKMETQAKLPRYIGKDKKELIDLFGKPLETKTINPSGPLQPYQTKIENFIKAANTDILEARWIQKENGKEMHLVVWFVAKDDQWFAVDSLLYDKENAKF